jgi:hypothetical protein
MKKRVMTKEERKRRRRRRRRRRKNQKISNQPSLNVLIPPIVLD